LKRKGLIVLAILLLPSLLYVFFALGKANFRKLPYHGPKAVRDTFINGQQQKDSIPYSLPAFSIAGTQRQQVSSNTFSGKPYIAAFISDWGPKTAKQLKGLAEYAKLKQEDLSYIKFVFFVQSDSSLPAPLPEVADTLSIDKSKCITLHGTAEEMIKLQKMYYVGLEGLVNKYINQAVLVDEKNHVRGYYDISSVSGMKTLKEDFEHLVLHDEAQETKDQFNIETKRK
jgi:cytochrome oxidase Cu insertion factor (SCO1/SenC/PrrC family)